LYADTRGALLVEYSVLIGAIAVAASFGLVTVGIALVHSFDFVRGLILCPIP
jgi:Flp pilus assembly pilin Flp